MTSESAAISSLNQMSSSLNGCRSPGEKAMELTGKNESEKIGDECTSGDDDWSDECGKLVIDLENESNDVEKAIKESKTDRVTPVRNNNNNNSSIGSSPGKHSSQGDKSIKASQSSANKAPGSRTQSPNPSGKSAKSKSKKSSKSSSGKQHSPSLSQSRGSSPASNMDNSNVNTGTAKSNHLSADGKTSSTGSLRASASSPDDVGGKKNKSKSSRSHHKKHKQHGNGDKGHSSGNRCESEKLKSKPKPNNGSALSGGNGSSSSFPQSQSSHYLPAHVNQSLSTVAVSNKHASSSARRSASPSLSNLSVVQNQSLKQQPSTGGPQGRQPTRTAIMPSSTIGAKSALQSGFDKESSNAEQANNHGQQQQQQPSRKKSRKGQSSAGAGSQTQSNSAMESNDQQQPQQQIRNYGSGQVQGKRERSSCAPTPQTTAGIDGSGAKKIKLDTDSKKSFSSGKESSFGGGSGKKSASGQRGSPEVADTRFIKTSTSSAFSSPQNATPSTAIFAPSSLFASAMPRYSTSGSVAQSSSAMQTSSVWSDAAMGTSSAVTSSRKLGTADVGVNTEEDALGPCEPGTSVHLDGIVWRETETGVLVVNVTWRNRTYMGTLLDATKHDWAPPRLSECDVDLDLRAKNSRSKRLRNGAGEGSTRKGRSRGPVSDETKGSPSAAAKKRGNKNSESENADFDVSSTPSKTSSKRARVSSSRNGGISQQAQVDQNTNGSNGGSSSSTCSSPVFIECPHPNCFKRYKHANGLKYHQAHAHLSGEESTTNTKGDVSPTDVTEEGENRSSDSEAGSAKDAPTASPPRATDEADIASSQDQTAGNAVVVSEATITTTTTQAAVSYPTSSALSVAADTKTATERDNYGRSSEPTAADSENAQAVKNLLLQFADSEDQPLPGLTPPYSQDSPAPTLTLGARSEYPGYRSDLSEYPSNYGSSAAAQPKQPFYQKPTPSTSKHEAVVVAPNLASQSPLKSSVPSPLSQASSAPSASVTYSMSSTSLPAHNTEQVQTGNIQFSSGALSTSEYYAPTTATSVLHPNGVKTAKGKTVPIPIGPSHAPLPPTTSVTSPNSSSKKPKPRKKKPTGEPGVEVPSHVKQESVPESAATPTSAFPPSAGAASALTSMAVNYQSQQRPPVVAHRGPGSEPAVYNNVPAQQIKSEPRYPPSFPSQQPSQPHAASRRIPGIVSVAPSSTVNHVTVAGTFHPSEDPHRPQTAVSAMAQDRLRASRNQSPTNPSSNRNNNNKLAGNRPADSNPSKQPPRPQDSDQDARPKYADAKHAVAAEPRFSESHVMLKMQDKVVSTIANEYRRSKETPSIPQRHQEPAAAAVRPASPVEIHSSSDEQRTRHRPGSPPPPSRPRVKENAAPAPREPSPDRLLQKNPIEAQFAGNPQAAFIAQQMQHLYGGYPQIGPFGFINPAGFEQAAAAGYHPQQFFAALRNDPNISASPLHSRQYELFHEAQKQHQLGQQIQQQQQQQQQHHQQHQLKVSQANSAERRARKPGEISEKHPIPKSEVAKHPPLSPGEATQDKQGQGQSHGKRHSTGSLSPFPAQPIRPQAHLPSPSHPRYKSPQPSHHLPMSTPNPPRSHTTAATPSGGHRHPRSESGERPRRPDIKEEQKAPTPLRKQSTPTPHRDERSPEKPKEGQTSVYRPNAESPGHIPYYQVAPGGAPPGAPYQLYDPTRPPFRGVPYQIPGYVYPHPGAPMFPPPSGWPNPSGQAPVHGKQSPPLKDPKDRPPSAPRSPKDDRGRQDPPEHSVHYALSKERRPREGPPSRKTSPSPDPKQPHGVANPNQQRITPSNPGELRPPSPPTQRHLHTHHHIHEGVTYNQFMPPQHYPYPGIPPTAVLAANPDGVPAAVYPNYNQKRE